MEAFSSPRLLLLLLLAPFFCCFTLLPFPYSLATDHIVGANHGWQPPDNAGESVHLNYTVWAASQKFYLNDEISFHYPENMQYSVFQVNYSVYTNCTISMWSGHDWIYNWTSKSGRTVVFLNKTGPYYFVDANNCNNGMKVAINVTQNTTDDDGSSSSSSTAMMEKSSASSSSSSYFSIAHLPFFTFFSLFLAQSLLFLCVSFLLPSL